MVTGLEITLLCSVGLTFLPMALALDSLLLISLLYCWTKTFQRRAVTIPQLNPSLELLTPTALFFIHKFSICFLFVCCYCLSAR